MTKVKIRFYYYTQRDAFVEHLLPYLDHLKKNKYKRKMVGDCEHQFSLIIDLPLPETKELIYTLVKKVGQEYSYPYEIVYIKSMKGV